MRRAEGPPAQRGRRRRARPRTLWMRVTSSASSRVERREDRRQPPREHRLAGARRAAQQHVMAARGGDRQRLDRRRVAADVAQIGRRHVRGALVATGGRWRALAAQRRRRARRDCAMPTHLDAVDERRLARALERHDEPVEPQPAARPRPRRASRAGAHLAAQRQLAEDRHGARALGAGSAPSAARIAQAIARSKPAPALRRWAGARLTVTRRCGNSKPELRIAALTRSRASVTARSARPTT